ncbi:MAG: GlsB/YeaQ/YmgE family stress response membrane protein [Hyphomicrobiaceae bacterium]|nr:GlsB/YeaQ/YmgE family stress response membrane protein [Hyphomicrobiaceae bacterium]
MNIETRALITFLIIGIAAGFIASLVVGGSGLVRYLITGVIGAFVGGYLFDVLGIDLGSKNRIASQIVTASVGAIVIIVLARLIA